MIMTSSEPSINYDYLGCFMDAYLVLVPPFLLVPLLCLIIFIDYYYNYLNHSRALYYCGYCRRTGNEVCYFCFVGCTAPACLFVIRSVLLVLLCHWSIKCSVKTVIPQYQKAKWKAMLNKDLFHFIIWFYLNLCQ